MKKRGILVFAMIIVCALLVYFVGNWQSKMYSRMNAISGANKSEANVQDRTVDKEIGNDDVQPSKADEVIDEAENAAKESSSVEKSKNESTNNTKAGSSGSSTGGSTTTSKSSSTGTKPASTKPSKPNLIIVDTIRNKTILAVRTSFNGANVYDITTRQLAKAGIAYKSNVTKDYIRSIAGLTEKNPDPKSGWIFYVNGKKSGIGAKSYVPKETDIIEWKFLKDALSN